MQRDAQKKNLECKTGVEEKRVLEMIIMHCAQRRTFIDMEECQTQEPRESRD